MFNWLKAKLLADLSLNHRIPLAMSKALSGEAGALLQVIPMFRAVLSAPPASSI
jgi:hypothetical protein